MSVGAVNKQTGDRIPTAGMPAIDNALSAISANPVQNAIITAALAGKQATLTFDSVPTDGSTNPVESNGVYDALALKQNATDNNLETTSKTVVGAVNELRSGLTNDYIEYKTDVEAPTRVNLFDKDNLDVVLKYYDGTEWKNQSQGQWETVFIPVVGGATYTLSGFPSQNGVQSVFTTSDKTTVLSKFGAGHNNETYTAPDNAAYIGLGVYEPNASFTSAQMELGTTATAYAPYIPSVESRIEAVESGVMKQVQLLSNQGDPATAINIDKISNGYGYMYKVYNGSGFSGTYPTDLGGNSFMLIGFSEIDKTSELPVFGVQIAFGFGYAKIAIRNAPYTAGGAQWREWKYIAPPT